MHLPPPDPLTKDVVTHIVGLRFEDLDESTVVATKKLLLDVLGAGIAGTGEDGCVQFRRLASEIGGKPEAAVIGSGDLLPSHVATAVNGAMCRALELDDVHEQAMIHTTATVVPAAMASAQSLDRPISGEDLVTAVSLGVDLAVRMSLAALVAQEPTDVPRVMSTTYQIGTYIAAATSAKIRALPFESTLHALGFAHSQAAGNQQAIYDGAHAVRVQQGLSAGAGVFSTRLAEVGLTAATRSLGGDAGYYRTFWAGTYDAAEILDNLGTTFLVDKVSIKPYPCCKFSHNAITAAIDIAERFVLSDVDIESVEVEVPSREYFNTVCAPVEEKQSPSSMVEAQFSLPYAVAVSILKGRPRLADFSQAGLADPEVRSLAKRVFPVLSEERSESRPAPATVTVNLRNDREPVSSHARVSPGHASQPLGWDLVVDKFEELCSYPDKPLPGHRVSEIVKAVQEVDLIGDVDRDLFRLLQW
jgi:2-methylcitrate dehydratase PrpD